MMQDANKLTPCFVPSLVATLISAEDKKGAPLSKDEVIHIRDNAPCIMMEASDIRKLEESRGYRDTDPENCWHDWQMTRRELGRQPDLDPGPRFGHIRTEDSDYQATIRQAHETLEQFRGMLPNDGSPREYASVKTELAYEDDRAFMWLCNTAIESEGFVAELFEVPDCLPNHTVGARLHIATAELLDWMVIDHGVLHGGFSLRYHRSTLSESEQLDFDRHIGVTRFA